MPVGVVEASGPRGPGSGNNGQLYRSARETAAVSSRRFFMVLPASALASRAGEPSVRFACLVITRAAVARVIGLPFWAFRFSVAAVRRT